MLNFDTLAMLGNFFGQTGNFGFFLIFLSATIYLVLIAQYKRLFKLFPGYSSDIEIVKDIMGILPGFFLFFVKIIAVIFLSTGLLVSSGFVFNEVFLYWFPNFAFAFILLGLLLGLQFLPDKIKFFFQIGFVSISIFGLLFLIIAGIIQSGIIQTDQIIAFKPDNTDYLFMSTRLNIFFMPILLFIGFDLGCVVFNKTDMLYSKTVHSIFFAVSFMCILFALWGFVSLESVAPQKLANTSIPHMIAARNILGDLGRSIMGIIVISGSLAFVHTLFTFISKQGTIIIKAIRLPKKINGSKILILSITLIIAGLMAAGLAGDEKLETFIRASLILWMISYAIISLSYILSFSRPGQKYYIGILFSKAKSLFFLLILVVCILILIGTDDNPILIVKFIGLSFLTSFILGIVFSQKGKK